MTTLPVQIPHIPNGHSLSFRKGVADGLLNNKEEHAETCHETHGASYQRGVEVGTTLRQEIASLSKE